MPIYHQGLHIHMKSNWCDSIQHIHYIHLVNKAWRNKAKEDFFVVVVCLFFLVLDVQDASQFKSDQFSLCWTDFPGPLKKDQWMPEPGGQLMREVDRKTI